MWKSLNYASKRQRGGTITVVEINVNVLRTRKDKQSEVEVLVMQNNRNILILTYGTPLMYGEPLHKDLVTLAHTISVYLFQIKIYCLLLFSGMYQK